MRIFELKYSDNHRLFVDLDRVTSVSVDSKMAYFTMISQIAKGAGCVNSSSWIPENQVEAFIKAWKNEVSNDGPYR